MGRGRAGAGHQRRRLRSPTTSRCCKASSISRPATIRPTSMRAPTRTINWTVSDGSNTTTATTELDVVAVNDAPMASVAATATYTENGPPLVISPAATASDVDDTNLVGGQVRIVTPLVGDLLTVNGLQSGTFAGIDFAYDPAAGRLLFGHPATVADFQTFMQAVEFSSTSDDPTGGGAIPTRTLSWALFDGDITSDLQTTVLTITAVNDPPAAQDGSASGSEDTPISGTLVATDVDDPTLTYALGTQAAHGTVVVDADGSYTYTPSAELQRHRQLHLPGERWRSRFERRNHQPHHRGGERPAGRAGRQRQRHRGHTAQRHAGCNRCRQRGPDLPPRHPGGAWHRGGQRGRQLHLHAGAGLQRHRQLHLRGQRHRGQLEHRHGQSHHRGGERCTACSISTPTTRPCLQHILRRYFPAPRTDLGSGRRDRGPGQRDARVRDHRPPHPEPRRSPLGERAAAGRDQRVGLRSRHRHSHAQR